MKLAVTGATGFIGKNLIAHLSRRQDADIVAIPHVANMAELEGVVAVTDFVFHLAGVNRTEKESELQIGNAAFTTALCTALVNTGSKAPIIYTSSIQADHDNPYGASKKAAEVILRNHAHSTGTKVWIYRLPNVFGKWSRPNYNSAVATFCHNIARGLPVTVHDPSSKISLVYIDDVCKTFLAVLDGQGLGEQPQVSPVYETTVGSLVDQIQSFKDSRKTLVTEPVGTGLPRALHATYLSFLPVEDFGYRVPVHSDPRGKFVEVLKTPTAGQFSYFTSEPGITRGIHYHHTKTEKFLVVKGTARFGFRHILTGEKHEITTSGSIPFIVETIPGWSHDITNIGSDEMVVLLWANENFDRSNPDTYSHVV